MSAGGLPEEYVTLVRVAEDTKLRTWFDSLPALPVNRRATELGRIAVQFHNSGDERLARVLRSLGDERIYYAVKGATDEFRCK